MRDNVSGAWDNFTGSVESATISLLTRFQPAIKDALDGLGGDLPRQREESGLVVELARQSGDRVFAYLGYGFQGWAESRMGQHEDAIQSMARSQAIGGQLGEQLLLMD